MDRMSLETTRVLPQDPVITETSALGLQDTSNALYARHNSQLTVKSSINNNATGLARNSSKPKIPPIKTELGGQTVNTSAITAPQSSAAKYNSVKEIHKPKPPIVFSDLHRKTYFNALEKMLMSPRHVQKTGITSNIGTASAAFEEVFKKPPSGYDSARPKN